MKIRKLTTVEIILAVFFFSCLSLGSSCCKKDNPPPTSNYIPPNSMSAKINGIDWKNCGPPTLPNIGGQYFQGNYFDIEGTAYCQQGNPDIYMKIFNLADTGYYNLGGTTNNRGEVNGPSIDSHGSRVRFTTDAIHIGGIQVSKFDITNKKISGTFQFDAFNVDSNKVVKVTDGKINDVTFY